MRVGHRLVVWGAWLVGVVLLFAAVQKSLDVLMVGVRLKGSPAHLKLLEYAQVAAIVPEMLSGAALLAGRPGKSAIVAATCLFMAFTLVAGVIAVYGHSDVLCACLGRRIHLPVYWHLTLNGAILSALGACLVWSERQSTEQPAGVQSSIRSGNAATWAWRIAIVLVVAVAVWVLLHRRSAHDHGERRVPEAARSSGWRARPLPPSGDDTSASEHALAASQGVAVSEPVPEQVPQTLSISTVAASGGPIGHARVDCVGAGRSRERIAVADLHATGHSNEHGVLALSCPGPAAEILARHPSFLPGAHKVTADEWARGAVTVVMHEGESIRGRVLTTSGSPVAGLTVRALGPRSGGMWRDSEGAIFGGEVLPDVREVATADDGTFRIAGLRPKEYVLTVVGGGWALKHTPTGRQAVRAGTAPVVLVVAQTLVAHGVLLDEATGRFVPLSSVFIDYEIPNTVEHRWEFGTTADQDLGESLPSPGPGEFWRVFQTDHRPASEVGVRLEIWGLCVESTRAVLPLRDVSTWDRSAPSVVRVPRRRGEWGSIEGRLPMDVRAADVSPYPLLLRPAADEDARWRRVPIEWTDDSGTGTVQVPTGRYELGGPFGTLVNGEKTSAVVVSPGANVVIDVLTDGARFGSMSLSVSHEAGIRMSDYYFRLVLAQQFDRGVDQPILQAWVGGAGPADGADVVRTFILAGQYILVVTKVGFYQHFARIDIDPGATTSIGIVLREE